MQAYGSAAGIKQNCRKMEGMEGGEWQGGETLYVHWSLDALWDKFRINIY